MAYKQQRPTIKVGKTSRAVILPKPWLDYHGEKANVLTLLGDAILILAPQGYEKKAQRLLEASEAWGGGSYGIPNLVLKQDVASPYEEIRWSRCL